MITGNGQRLATERDVCRVTQVCKNGVVMVTDPATLHYGFVFVNLPEYMFNVMT